MDQNMRQDPTLRLIAKLIDKDRATFGPDEQTWWAGHSAPPLQVEVVRPCYDRDPHDVYVLARCGEYAVVFHDGHEIFCVVPLRDGQIPAEGNPFDTLRDAVRWFLQRRRAEYRSDFSSNTRSDVTQETPATIRSDGLYFGLTRCFSELTEDYECYFSTLRFADDGTVLAGAQVDYINPNTDAPEIARWLVKDGLGVSSGRFLLEAGFITIDIDYPRGASRYLGTVSEDRLYLEESWRLKDSDDLRWPILFRFVPV